MTGPIQNDSACNYEIRFFDWLRSTLGAICFVSIVSVFSTAAFAEDCEFVVAKDGSGDFISIQLAIAAVGDQENCDNAVITIKPGVYKENPFVTNQNIRFQSIDIHDPEIVAQTIIDGCNQASVFLVSSDQPNLRSASFYGLTIRNGSVGAIESFDVELDIFNSVFENNFSPFDGGAIFLFGGSLILDSSKFIENASLGRGGGVFVTGNGIFLQQLLVCDFEFDDIAADIPCGGALMVFDDTENLGVGIPIETVMIGGRVENCLAGMGGGAFAFQGTNAFVSDTVFRKNGAFGSGGAIESLPNTDLTLMNCVFDGNLANGAGGAIANIDGNINVVNGTFTNNDAATGEIVATTNAANTSFVNSIFWGNGGGMLTPEEGGNFAITFSIVEGGFPGQGNVDLDPLFVDPLGDDGMLSSGDEDLSLSAGSPAIDAANNNAIPMDVFDIDGDQDLAELFPTDMNGATRFSDEPQAPDTGVGKGPIADMGAFEFQTKSDVLLGDVNLDGVVNLLDVDPFIERIGTGVFQAEADTNLDGAINLLDIDPFIAILGGI